MSDTNEPNLNEPNEPDASDYWEVCPECGRPADWWICREDRVPKVVRVNLGPDYFPVCYHHRSLYSDTYGGTLSGSLLAEFLERVLNGEDSMVALGDCFRKRESAPDDDDRPF
jgi:hypothetical protein